MDVRTGKVARSYMDFLSDINGLNKLRNGKKYTMEHLYENYMQNGFIPKQITLDDINKLKGYTKKMMQHTKRKTHGYINFSRLNIGECVAGTECKFIEECGDKWNTAKPLDYGVHIIDANAQLHNQMESILKENKRKTQDEIVTVLNTLVNVKNETDQMRKELYSHTHLPWCYQQINKINTLQSSLDEAIRSLRRCVGVEETLSIYLPDHQNIKHEHTLEDNKGIFIDNSTINDNPYLSSPGKIVTFESESIKRELIGKEEFDNDAGVLHDENDLGIERFEDMDENCFEKHEMNEFEADDKVDDDILDNFDEEDNAFNDENIPVKKKRKGENPGDSPRKKINGSHDKHSDTAAFISPFSQWATWVKMDQTSD